MKQRIEQLLESIGKLMQGHLAKREFDAVTQLSTLLARVQQLQKRATELEADVSEIEASLKAINGKSTSEQVAELVPRLSASEAEDAGRAGPQTLRIEIDWRANGRQREKEVILQPMAADSMVLFLSRLVEELGQDALQKLRIPVNRGPLISKSPKTDFLNRAQGKMYGNKRLPGTDYFVLTHSQTSQKVDDLNRVCKALELVPGSVQIRTVDRADSYKELYAGLSA